MPKPVIQVQKLSKKFRIGKKSGDLRQTFRNIFSMGKKDPLEIWALKDIDFEVNEGEVFGIIGPNGSGKSTLLKILSKITYPTSGKAVLRGRVSSLLEVGTGFHPELTGRENIYLNGSILGMKRAEIKNKFDEIVDFSGIEQFIDTPVKHYSSGMYVRLAFSVAAHLEPEILLVDEVLSVGDMAFRQKSIGKMNEVAQSGRTVLFVSHNLGVIKDLCTKGIYLNDGKIMKYGNIVDVVNEYYNKFYNKSNLVRNNYKNDLIEVKSLKIYSTNIENNIIRSGEYLTIIIEYKSKKVLTNVMVKMKIKNNERITVFECSNRLLNKIYETIPQKGQFICKIPKLPLNIGFYTINVYMEQNNIPFLKIPQISKFEVFAGHFYKSGIMPFDDRLILVEQEWSINEF